MSANTTILPPDGKDNADGNSRTHSVHIRDVPETVWCRARQNALLSGLPFKEYVTRLLGESVPFPRQHAPAS